jgi:hypothetical protein
MAGKFGRYKPTKIDSLSYGNAGRPYQEDARILPKHERAFDRSVQCIIGKHNECKDVDCLCPHHENRRVD